jgi:hypothetical protein
VGPEEPAGFRTAELIFSLNLCRVFLRMGERLRGMNILFLAVMILEALLLPLSFFSDYRGMTPAPVALAALTALWCP